MPRITEHKRTTIKSAFITALRDELTVGVACELAGVSRRAIYTWRNEDAAFASEWDAATEHAIDVLATSLYRRALDHDTTAAIFLLKSHRRETYGDKMAVQITLKQEVERLAAELDLPYAEVLAEAEAIFAAAR